MGRPCEGPCGLGRRAGGRLSESGAGGLPSGGTESGALQQPRAGLRAPPPLGLGAPAARPQRERLRGACPFVAAPFPAPCWRGPVLSSLSLRLRYAAGRLPVTSVPSRDLAGRGASTARPAAAPGADKGGCGPGGCCLLSLSSRGGHLSFSS